MKKKMFLNSEIYSSLLITRKQICDKLTTGKKYEIFISLIIYLIDLVVCLRRDFGSRPTLDIRIRSYYMMSKKFCPV